MTSPRFALAGPAAFVWIVLAGVCCSRAPTFSDDGAGAGSASGGACTVAEDCPGDESECVHRACDDGVCTVEYAPAGFAVVQQASGDCKKSVCDGHGAVTQADDDADVPNDGNACTLDACESGAPSTEDAPKGTACGQGGTLTCDGQGHCTGCNAASDCGVDGACVGYACEDQTCVIHYTPEGTADPGAQVAGDCHVIVCNGAGATDTVVDDADVPDDSNACTIDSCSMGSGAHANAPAGTTCGAGFECDGKGACGGCATDADCGQSRACATYACVQGACSATFVPAGQGSPPGGQPGDCQKLVCDGNGGTKSAPDDGDVPSNDDPCAVKGCSGGAPTSQNASSGTACSAGGGHYCNGAGSCVECLSNAQCSGSNACRTAVCSGNACSFTYVANGTPAGTQTSGDCKKSVCDGSGNVVQTPDDDPPASTQCATRSCSNGSVVTTNVASGTACSESGGSFCNGSGACVECTLATQCGNAKCSACLGGSCSYQPAGTVCGASRECDGAGICEFTGCQLCSQAP